MKNNKGLSLWLLCRAAERTSAPRTQAHSYNVSLISSSYLMGITINQQGLGHLLFQLSSRVIRVQLFVS